MPSRDVRGLRESGVQNSVSKCRELDIIARLHRRYGCDYYRVLEARILKERFEEGTQLVVRLQTTAVTRPLPVKVVHVVEIARDFYLLGGAFTSSFSASDLHKLVS